jgi:hypothetical protein
VGTHCAKAKYKRCHPSLKTCVACKRRAHCTSSTAPYCSTKTGSCLGTVAFTCLEGRWRKVACKSLGLTKCRQVNYAARCGDPSAKKPAP